MTESSIVSSSPHGPVELGRALDSIDVAVIIQGRASQILYANRRALELLGRSRRDALGLSSFDPSWNVVNAQGRAVSGHERPVARVLATGEPVLEEVLGVERPGEGQRSWMLVSAHPQLDAEGEVAAVVVTLSDITTEHNRIDVLDRTRQEMQRAVEARAAELAAMETELAAVRTQRQEALQALAERNVVYATVVGVMSEGVALHEPDGRIQTANAAAQRILGLSLDQLTGTEAVDARWRLTDEEGEPLAEEDIPSEITRTTGKPCRNVLLGVEKGSGERAWLRVSSNPIPGAQGIEGVVATFADVTEERSAHLALAESRAAFERVTEAIPGVIYELTRDEGERLSFVSARVEDLFGVSADAAIADVGALYALVHPEDRAAVLAPPQGEGRSAWENEFRVMAAAGFRWLRCEAVQNVERRGEVWTGVVLDVTEERQLAEQLRHSQRREAMGDLAAGVAHNFNNVLAAILPNLEDLRTAVAPEQEPMVEDALQAARGAADMVRQLMVTTRRDPTRREDHVDVARVAGEVVNLCQRSFDRRIAISLDVRIPGATVRARASDLHQILLNLCINARDALVDTAEPTLRVVVDSAEGAPHDLVVEVHDNGSGMSSEVQKRLGEPFFTTKAPGKGTGLGLATVYSIVQDMEAALVCYSELGRGTTFELRLHRVERPAPASLPLSHRSTSRSFAGLRTLLIDDDHLVRRAVARHLARYDLDVTQATDGLDGLAKFRSLDRVDIVILDLSMPGASGQEVLASIRTADAEVPVIVMTGFVPEGAALGEATAVLIKPLDLDTLLQEIRRATKLPDTVLPISD